MPEVQEKVIIRELGNGLILRRSTPADAEKLFHFNSQIHGDECPDERVGQLARDLLEKPHPTFGVHDFTIIEEKTTGRIVSSLNHISQTWTYDGIPFGVGRPELVGTLPEYRNQGLVRIQFDEIHNWSAERGELAQAITGIPNFYRQFGYEMCVDLSGSRSGSEATLPQLAENLSESFRLRQASEADIPFLISVYTHASQRSLLYAVRNEALWKLELAGRSEKNADRLVWNIIERTANGEAVGFLAHSWFASHNTIPVSMYELKAGISWLEVSPSVVRWLWKLNQKTCAQEGKQATTYNFALGGSHPVYEVMKSCLPQVDEPYTWFIRVPDLAAFIKKITPVLEKRLAGSLIPGHTGELKLNFYRWGLWLTFEGGHISNIQNWQPDSGHEGDASFPGLTFLQALFGHRSLDDLRKSYADCFWKNDEARTVVSILFPRKPSQILPIV